MMHTDWPEGLRAPHGVPTTSRRSACRYPPSSDRRPAIFSASRLAWPDPGGAPASP